MKLQLILIASLFLFNNVFSQDITFVPRHTSISDTMGKEIVFEIDVTNISAIPQTLFIVRTQSNLPATWSSSLCLDFCFPGHIDSVATTPDFGSNPLQPGETREVSLHVYTSPTVPGQGTIQMKAGTFRNPNQTITHSFQATTFNPTNVEDYFTIDNFVLEQNYPNPFNPATTISYYIPSSCFVNLKVFDVLGNEVETLVNEEKSSGYYQVEFSGKDGVTSGVYFYQIRAGNYFETKKMILEK
jgi:hypothetical protein